jgi:hypothetical protein
VLPTWLVLRDHQPIEHNRSDDIVTPVHDEEQPTKQLKGKNSSKGNMIVGERHVTE